MVGRHSYGRILGGLMGGQELLLGGRGFAGNVIAYKRASASPETVEWLHP